MGREERQALLHEGSGSAVMSAYVEVIFDNSDDRFPTGNKEVIVRRTIGLKKDEYSLDRKAATKADVMNLLEAAGFSRSNPYYIVPQGRVTALTNMKESERLNLLKEVAGTQVYEARRTESLKILHDTDNKRAKIDELLAYIAERLNELEEEKEELRAYQEKDRERRCLEYAYYRKEQLAVEEALQGLEDSRQDGVDNAEDNRKLFRQREKEIAQVESEIHKLKQQVELLKIDRRQLEEDRREGAKALAKVELQVKSLQDGQAEQEEARQQHAAELSAVREKIRSDEAELARLTPEYEKRKKKETEAKNALDAVDAARNRLATKQSRGAQFKTKAERDEQLRKEIRQLNEGLASQKASFADTVEEVRKAEGDLKKLEKEVQDMRAQLENFGGVRVGLFQQVAKAREAFDKLNEERKALRRDEEKLESKIASARAESAAAERELSQAMDRATAQGLATIRRLKAEKNIPGAYGTLAELMEVSEVYRLPVEQIAGASLFHYVVDTDDTATTLATALQRQHGGRVTFMPLNKLRPRQVNLPRANDAVPLVSKIQYDRKYDKAFQQVFGRTVICPNLTIASQYARSHGVDGITPDGDTTNKRGAMTGGYVDPGRSRLDAMKAVNASHEQRERLYAEADRLRNEIEDKDREVTQALSELRKLEQQLRQKDDSFDPFKERLEEQTRELDRTRERLDALTLRRDTIEAHMKNFTESLQARESEMASEFKKALSAQEEQELERLTNQVQALQKQWNDASNLRRETDNRKKFLEFDLRNLRVQLDQLNSRAFEASGFGDGSNLQEALRELKKAEQNAKRLQKAVDDCKAKIRELEAEIVEQEAAKARMEEQNNELAKQIERQQKRMEKALQQKALLTTRAAESAKNIKDLGVLPDEAFNNPKYLKLDSKAISSRLKKVNEALKKYKHINKKAFEQYNSFTTQQEQLLKRRQELDASHKSIEELVSHLDMRKDEAIERTFKQVSKEFATIFERLVPAGHGRLVIQRRADRRGDPEDSDEEQRGSVENYTGVGISVSFNSKHMDEQQKIQQLSGGQKSEFFPL